MKKQGGGTIVDNALMRGIKGIKERAAYGASKKGVVALSEVMAADHFENKIRVKCVYSGSYRSIIIILMNFIYKYVSNVRRSY